MTACSQMMCVVHAKWLQSCLTLRPYELKPARPFRVRSLGWKDPLEEELATHSSILAWEIPWTKKPGRL